jgi:hypothetical protein
MKQENVLFCSLTYINLHKIKPEYIKQVEVIIQLLGFLFSMYASCHHFIFFFNIFLPNCLMTGLQVI